MKKQEIIIRRQQHYLVATCKEFDDFIVVERKAKDLLRKIPQELEFVYRFSRNVQIRAHIVKQISTLDKLKDGDQHSMIATIKLFEGNRPEIFENPFISIPNKGF